jgi:hypothetical protein
VLIARKRLEKKLIEALNADVRQPEVLELVYERTAKKIKEHFAHIPEELRLMKIELHRAETRVHNFIEFIASGRATPGLADALAEAEENAKRLRAHVASLEAAKHNVFTPPHARLDRRAHQGPQRGPREADRDPRPRPTAGSPAR